MDAPTRIRPWDQPPHDAADFLAFWLGNPLLLHHYPQRMAATAATAADLPDREKRLLGFKLVGQRLKCRTQKALPQGLPEMSSADFRALVATIDDAPERAETLHFGLRLHPCELPWLAARIRAVLANRTAQLATEPEYPH